MIDISGLEKAAVLAALYNASQPLGMGFLHFTPEDMTENEAQTIIDERAPSLYFDYLKGRVMKVDLAGDALNPWGFDRDNGEGAAARAIDTIR